MNIYLFILLIFCLYFSYWDIKTRKIKNRDVLFFLLFQCIFLGCFNVLTWQASLLVLFFGFLLFICKIIAAGDVKLATIFALGIDMDFISDALLLMSLIGGLQAIYYLVRHLYYKTSGKGEINHRGLPYGVAICSGFYCATILTLIS